MDQFITVATFSQPHEMAVARSVLENEGIACRTQDEFTVSAHPFYSNAIGGVKLQVAAKDVEAATAVLTEGGFLPTGPSSPDDPIQKFLLQCASGFNMFMLSLRSPTSKQWRTFLMILISLAVVALVVML